MALDPIGVLAEALVTKLGTLRDAGDLAGVKSQMEGTSTVVLLRACGFPFLCQPAGLEMQKREGLLVDYAITSWIHDEMCCDIKPRVPINYVRMTLTLAKDGA